MTEIYLAKTHLLLKTGYGNPEMYSHSVSHIIIGLKGDMKISVNGESVVCSGAFLPSGVSHTVDDFGIPSLVFMFDVTSKVSDERIMVAMRFVKEHLNNDVTVRDAAESVYLSEGSFPICSGKRQGY